MNYTITITKTDDSTATLERANKKETRGFVEWFLDQETDMNIIAANGEFQIPAGTVKSVLIEEN